MAKVLVVLHLLPQDIRVDRQVIQEVTLAHYLVLVAVAAQLV
jgi:hypothetical protein